MKRAVITGPTGGIGIFLTSRLVNEGVSVTTICRPGSERIKNIPRSALVNIVECDLTMLRNLPEELEDADVFYHMGWGGTFGSSRNDMHRQIANLDACIDAVQLADRLNCKKFVGVGSTNEYGNIDGKKHPDMPCNPNNGYGIMKYCAGKMALVECKKLGLEYNWCRIGSAYGPYTADYTLISGALARMLKGERVKFTKAEQRWSFIYNGDVAKALYLVALKGKDGATYNIAGSESGILKDYIAQMRDIVNPMLEIGIGEIPYYENQVFNIEADISDLVKDTGYAPEYSFEEGIRETVKWIKSRETCE